MSIERTNYLKCNMSAACVCDCCIEKVWNAFIMQYDTFEHEDFKTFVADGISLNCRKDNIVHHVTFKIAKCDSPEEVTKEHLTFFYYNNDKVKNNPLESLMRKNITHGDFKTILEYYSLPELTSFKISKIINFTKTNFFNHLYMRNRGVIYKTMDCGLIVNLIELTNFTMEIYAGCVVEHKYKNALSGDDEY